MKLQMCRLQTVMTVILMTTVWPLVINELMQTRTTQMSIRMVKLFVRSIFAKGQKLDRVLLILLYLGRSH